MYKRITAAITTTIMITGLLASLATAGASPGVSLSSETKTVKEDAWVKLTITVTNDTGENIENIFIKETSDTFDVPMGGSDVIAGAGVDAWENVADNLDKAKSEMSKVSDNLEEAVTDKKAAGSALDNAAEDLDDVGGDLIASGRENATTAGSSLASADEDLKAAASGFKSEPENLLKIASNLDDAATDISNAGTALSGDTNSSLENAGDNLSTAATELNDAAEGVRGGVLWEAANAIDNAAENIDIAGEQLGAYSGTGSTEIQSAGDGLENEVAPWLRKVAENLRNAATDLREAGTALNTIRDDYLANAEYLRATSDQGDYEYFDTDSDNALDNAAIALFTENAENVIAAGNWLRTAETRWFAFFDTSPMFGGDDLKNSSEDLGIAGDRMRDNVLDLKVAASALDNAASDWGAAAVDLKDADDALKPDGWDLSRPANGRAKFSANETKYQIEDGDSETFTWFWQTPDLSDTENDFDMQIFATAPDGTERYMGEVTVTVDGKPPALEILVTQSNVEENNVVGNTYDNGEATLTITANEEVSALGTVYIENSGQPENLLPPISWTDLDTTDNKKFTYKFDVSTWDDNSMRVRIWDSDQGFSAKDLVGNENTSAATQSFIVDTRAPKLLDNGLDDLMASMIGQKNQAGTGNLYWVDNETEQTLEGNVADNYSGARLGYENYEAVTYEDVVIEWADVSATANPVSAPDNGFRKTLDLTEGLNSVVKVTATDWTGNSTSDNVENIFIDTTAPSISSWTINGETWDENSELINDKTPTIAVSIIDGTEGLGVAYENLYVLLDNDDNMSNTDPGFGGRLDNAHEYSWVVATGENFENTVDNLANPGAGLADGTYWIGVSLSDNLKHNGSENVIRYRSFTIDVIAPSGDLLRGRTSLLDPDTMGEVPSATNKTSMLIKGYASESGSTVNIYAPDKDTLDTSVTASTTLTAKGYSFETTITLSEGKNQKIWIQEVDAAGNESTKELLGTKTVDITDPMVTISAPATGTSTSSSSIVVSGTATDAIADYDELDVTIDATGAYVKKDVYLNSDDSFSTSVPLEEGNNVISVIAEDTAGNRTIEHVTVKRTVTPWAMYAMILGIIIVILAAIAVARRS